MSGIANIPRLLDKEIADAIAERNKAIVVYGARQVGKTTLLRRIIAESGFKALSINADEERHTDTLSSRDLRRLGELVAGYELLFIDEAQRIPNIGINLKLLLDHFPKLKIVVTGSSALEIADEISEPLTGRKITFTLYPIALVELASLHSRHELREMIRDRLVFGGYPEIFRIQAKEDRERYLRELTTDYLYKDLLRMAEIRNSHKLRALLKLLAFQVGSEASLSELGTQLGIGKDTVARYIDLLQKAFIVFELGGFNQNLRKEVTKMKKYYFYDLGFRNVLVENLSPVEERKDLGPLWENFCVVERMKRNAYTNAYGSSYFWRTYDGDEVDYVEHARGALHGFEFKYGRATAAAPRRWVDTYPEATWTLVGETSWENFLLA